LKHNGQKAPAAMERKRSASPASGAAGPASRSAQRRQREREMRLQSILAAAGRLFAAEGYHQTGMERIADEAELAVGTLYFYFKNKEDLLIHLLDQTGHELRDLLGQAFREADGTLEGIRQAGRVFFESFCPRHPAKIALFFRESAGQSEAVERLRKRIFDKLSDDVQAALQQVAQRQGGFRSAWAAEVVANSILGMFERLAYHYLIWQDRRDELGAVGRDAVAFILGGIRGMMGPDLDGES
jgi:AcrR family transcriptional regulator